MFEFPPPISLVCGINIAGFLQMFRVECGGVIGREGREARWVAGFGIVGLSGLDR